ncbi:hypothetical protein ANCDUO_13586 [Ancylostoma duodenale]|uniref:Uncharacterized protein n=1 Tax=Ancylostoma duodenale TaxID=51022 RepID=A0A0C2GBF1_9BILA|nr:hypothetical protein ANCDUO_13586 [Ancylostoma duodenale]
MNCFNAPSIALTYKPVPDLPLSLMRPSIVLDIVILGHSCLFTLSYMDNITTFLPELAKSRWLAPVLLNSSLAVDSFLFISGAVVAFTVRKRILFRCV